MVPTALSTIEPSTIQDATFRPGRRCWTVRETLGGIGCSPLKMVALATGGPWICPPNAADVGFSIPAIILVPSRREGWVFPAAQGEGSTRNLQSEWVTIRRASGPAGRLKPLWEIRQNRARKMQRFLSRQKLARLGRALEIDAQARPAHAAAVQLILLIGCRSLEILQLGGETLRRCHRSHAFRYLRL